MMNLFLNGARAVVASGMNIKFVVDNQAFSDQGEYTHEVTLPIEGCRTNAEIFGPIIRRECTPNRLKGVYWLETDIFSSWGDFKVLEATEELVKIQLLAKKSRANNRIRDDKGNELYIDELPLGTFLDEYDLDGELGPAISLGNPPYRMKDYAEYFSAGGMWRIQDTSKRNNCVLFPIISTRVSDTELDRANIYKLNDNGRYVLDLQPTRPSTLHVLRENLAFQPKLMEVLRRVFRAVGVDFRHRLGPIADRTYLANARCTPHYTGVLPHWTIPELIKEVSNMFNAVPIYDGYSVEFIKRTDLFKGKSQPIDDVTDEFVMQCDDESADDYSAAGNVDYDWPVEDPILRVPDEVWELAQTKHFPSISELSLFDSQLSKSEKELSRYLMIDDKTGEVYAHLQDDQTSDFSLTRIDWYPPLLRDPKTRSIQTSLRITPVRIEFRRVGKFLLDYPCMVVDDVIQTKEIYSVNNQLKPASESALNAHDADKRDGMEVFFYDGSTLYGEKNFPMPIGVMVGMNDAGLPEQIPYRTENRDLSPLGAYILSETQSNQGKQLVDTNRIYRFSFIKKGPIDIDRPFLIKGRKYIGKQLQYDCREDGIHPLISGEFYALR